MLARGSRTRRFGGSSGRSGDEGRQTEGIEEGVRQGDGERGAVAQTPGATGTAHLFLGLALSASYGVEPGGASSLRAGMGRTVKWPKNR